MQIETHIDTILDISLALSNNLSDQHKIKIYENI